MKSKVSARTTSATRIVTIGSVFHQNWRIEDLFAETAFTSQGFFLLVAGDRISGSTGNDGVYTVVSDSGASPTTITVLEAIPNATVDSLIHTLDLTIQNTRVNVG